MSAIAFSENPFEDPESFESSVMNFDAEGLYSMLDEWTEVIFDGIPQKTEQEEQIAPTPTSSNENDFIEKSFSAESVLTEEAGDDFDDEFVDDLMSAIEHVKSDESNQSNDDCSVAESSTDAASTANLSGVVQEGVYNVELGLHLPLAGKVVRVSDVIEKHDSAAQVPQKHLPKSVSFTDIPRSVSVPLIASPSPTKRRYSFPEAPKTADCLDKKKSRPNSRSQNVEIPALQNLGGLQTLRVPNKFNDFTKFSEDGFLAYELAPRAHKNLYEPQVIRTNLGEPDEGNCGLCPYCPTAVFLSMKTSAYLHHMTVNHGIFSNGALVKEPGCCVKDVLTNSGKKEKMEFFTCPYDGCELKDIRMKKTNVNRPDDNRYKVYLRHVKDCHGCGKRDSQNKPGPK